jgi:peroxiredoxin
MLSLAVVAAACLFTEHAQAQLAIGASAPAFNLPGADGKSHSLAEFRSKRALAVVFLCNHCTESQLYESRVQKLTDDYAAKGVAVVAIQPDNAAAITPRDLAYSDVGESLIDMKERASFRHFTFPYLYDGESQQATTAFGATVTPEVFVFDAARKLRYTGSLDDSAGGSAIKTSYVRDALDAVLAGKPVATATTKPAGCNIIPNSAKATADAELAREKQEPVALDLATPAKLTELRNNGTGKFLLVNFFATWCGPCVSEFPDLMDTWRMYRDRPFTATIVSSNDPEERPDVEAFLKKNHASTRNLLFGSDDTYAMQAAFDPNMGSAVPFTVLIAPNGDILFQQQGDIDMLRLRRAILANLPDDPAHKGSQKYWSTP